jgi:hypothetical protein
MGRNFDAFNDLLRGGFGTPEGGFIFCWVNSNISRENLGNEATLKWLESGKKFFHPLPELQRSIKAAKPREGPTLFDILVDIHSNTWKRRR